MILMKITEQEQINLRQQALDELNRLETILQEVETRELLDKYSYLRPAIWVK